MNKFVYHSLFAVLLCAPSASHGDFFCKDKKSGAVTIRKVACKGKETSIAPAIISYSTSSPVAQDFRAAGVGISNSGAITGGADTSTGFDVSVNRTGARGGTINNTGVNISVVGDGGGDSTNVGLNVNTSGADANYCAIFQGGNVGIGVNTPSEALDIAGRLHLGTVNAPSDVTGKLYNVGGSLYWAGQPVGVGQQSTGTISGVTAGTGLSGGGTSGNVTLSINTGTSANNVVQLNSSAELPGVSGTNLTQLNAGNIASGTISDSRLSSNVSLLGNSIGLTSEVSGILPISNGGTGASSLTDLIALSTDTTGNYVANVATSAGITGGSAGSEGASLALSIDQAFSPNWSGTHSFQGNTNFGTTAASNEIMHVLGRVQLDSGTAPLVTTDKLYNVAGDLYFAGKDLSAMAAGGDITAVTAGTGLTGGGTTGAVTLNVDAGSSANKIVQLNSSAQLPAVSGANLTNLNASNLASGTIPDGRLSANVSLLGPSISLASEVSGTLPIANGGTGATSLADLIALGTDTTGNYVASIAVGTGITLVSTGAEGGTATLSLDQSVLPVWTSTHTFTGPAVDITTGSSENFCIVPGGTGKVGIGTTTPSAMLESSYLSTNTTAGTEIGAKFSISDSGNVSSGTDVTKGAVISVSRTGASGGVLNSTGLDLSVTGDTNGSSTTTGINVSVSGADTNYAALFNGGSVGIGTTSPTALLDSEYSSNSATAGTEVGALFSVSDSGVVNSGTDVTYGAKINVSRTGPTGGTINTYGLAISGTGTTGGTSTLTGLDVVVSGADTNIAANFSGGSVAIGTPGGQVTSTQIPSGSFVVDNGALCVDDGGNHCDDALRSAGTIYARTNSVTGVDLAENFPVEEGSDIQPGEIVMIDSKRAPLCAHWENSPHGPPTCTETKLGTVPFVTRSTHEVSLRKRVIGVVSTEPGYVLGGYGQSGLIQYKKVPVALAGRIPLKISLENGPVEIGDRIVPSSTPGVGMKASDGEVLPVAIALESYDEERAKTEDRILVLVK